MSYNFNGLQIEDHIMEPFSVANEMKCEHPNQNSIPILSEIKESPFKRYSFIENDPSPIKVDELKPYQ